MVDADRPVHPGTALLDSMGIYACCPDSATRKRAVSTTRALQSPPGMARAVSAIAYGAVLRPSVGRRKPSVLVPLVVAVAIAGAAVPWLLGYAPYGQQAIDQQIDPEDGALCAKFGFAPRTQIQHSDCKAALADLRHRPSALLAH